jgi:hypothetical protein
MGLCEVSCSEIIRLAVVFGADIQFAYTPA